MNEAGDLFDGCRQLEHRDGTLATRRRVPPRGLSLQGRERSRPETMCVDPALALRTIPYIPAKTILAPLSHRAQAPGPVTVALSARDPTMRSTEDRLPDRPGLRHCLGNFRSAPGRPPFLLGLLID